jgi:hypothetical protein
LLGFQKFNVAELTKGNDIIKQIFGKESIIEAKKDFKQAEGCSFAVEVPLKQTRSGKCQIEGRLHECLHINLMNLVGVMQSKNGARSFLVRAHQSNFLVCFIELKKGLLKDKEFSLKEFRSLLKETFKSMEPSDQHLQDYDLWVPNFRLKIACDKASEESWKKGEKDADHMVSFFDLQIESSSDGELIKRSTGDKSIVLSEGFIVGIMDTAHEEKYDLPVFAALVKPDCFIQK